MKRLITMLIFVSVFLANMTGTTDSVQVQYVNVADTIIPVDKISEKNISFNGQITGWTVVQFSNPVNSQLAGRILPSLTGFYSFPEKSRLDFEASLNLNGALYGSGSELSSSTYTLKPYRIWLRYGGENWEVRGGLQKINFGQAKIFRPLMWFDEMDVRDPLQLTDGVYGLLGKYFFRNNTNIWLWTLIGNKNPKGFELLGSASGIPEIGGRVETPLGPGEMALSTHFRKADIHSLNPVAPQKTYISESRIGLDGKWDIGPGIWFEASISRFEKTDYPLSLFQDMWNLGADYTLPVGAGLNVSVEYFRFHLGNTIWREGTSANLAGAMLSYPVSLLDTFSVLIFYAKEAEKWFNYVSYARTYDNWNIYLIGFWNPEINLPITGKLGGKNLFTGKGLQIMLSYHF